MSIVMINYYYSVEIALSYEIKPDFSNHQIIVCPILCSATTSLRINAETKLEGPWGEYIKFSELPLIF